MNCRDIPFELPLYCNEGERLEIDEHLALCPHCSQKLSDLKQLRRDLGKSAAPKIPESLVTSLRSSVAAEIRFTRSSNPFAAFTATTRDFLQMRIMPYSVGAFASLALAFVLVTFLFSEANRPGYFALRGPSPESPVLLANANPNRDPSVLDPREYALNRGAVAMESPSVNPRGALVALTKSLVRGDMKDDEVTVVADVFGDGLAQIAEVVEPSQDIEAVSKLERALKTDPAYAPFVPADLDGRSASVRVILKIQNVDVSTRPKSRRR